MTDGRNDRQPKSSIAPIFQSGAIITLIPPNFFILKMLSDAAYLEVQIRFYQSDLDSYCVFFSIKAAMNISKRERADDKSHLYWRENS